MRLAGAAPLPRPGAARCRRPGIVVLDFDGAVASLNPAAERLLGRTLPTLTGRRARRAGDAARGGAGGARAGRVARRRLRRRAARALPVAARSSIAASRAASSLIEELTEELRQAERAAYEKLIRMMSHEVNNSVAASTRCSLVPHLRRRAGGESRATSSTPLGVVIARTAQLNAFMKSFADVVRLPAPARQPASSWRSSSASCALLSARPDAAGIAWRWEVDAPSIRGARRSRRRWNRRSSTSSRTPSRRSTATGAVTIRRDVERRAADAASIEDTGAGPRPGGAGQPVHAVLQHQAERPGHRPDAGRRDPRRPRLRLRPRTYRPRHHCLPDHVHLTTTHDSGVPPTTTPESSWNDSGVVSGNPNKHRGFERILATTPESCAQDSGVVPSGLRSRGWRQWTRKVTPVHCFTPPAPAAGVQMA